MRVKSTLATIILTCITATSQASNHHSGHNGGGGAESGGASCLRPRIDKMKPAHLETVAPGSEFSFFAFNIDDPTQLSVKVKQIEVGIETEFKEPNYIVKGKLPASLHDTAARIDVKIDSKYSSCRAEQGWLIKISDNQP